MRTFLCALCILLFLLSAVIAVTQEVLMLTDRMIALTLALPPVGAADCEEAVAALVSLWQRLRPLVDISASGRTVEQIGRSVASLEVCARLQTAEDFELYRRLLIEALRDMRALMGIGWGTVF